MGVSGGWSASEISYDGERMLFEGFVCGEVGRGQWGLCFLLSIHGSCTAGSFYCRLI